MLERFWLWWHGERRQVHTHMNGHDRRAPTLQQANARLKSAADDFTNTVTLNPERVRELLERARR